MNLTLESSNYYSGYSPASERKKSSNFKYQKHYFFRSSFKKRESGECRVFFFGLNSIYYIKYDK